MDHPMSTDVTIPPTPTPDGLKLDREVLIPANEARAIRVRAGEVVQIIDVLGQQVSDVMVWRLDDPTEYLSPSHTVSCLAHLVPVPGEALYSNHRRPLLRVRVDTVGNHDLVVPCCDPERYRNDFGVEHVSCLSAIEDGMELAGETWVPRAELAWNCFMNNSVTSDGRIVTAAGPHVAGDYIELDVLVDLGMVASSCPQDLTPCNGFNITPMAFRVFGRQ
jgi:uncharacterized protein